MTAAPPPGVMAPHRGCHGIVTPPGARSSMVPTDLTPWFGGAALATGAWLGHRLLRWLERRGWLYYLGLDV
jgi:hypothetical protein